MEYISKEQISSFENNEIVEKLDFLFWGVVKDPVYPQKFTGIESLKASITRQALIIDEYKFLRDKVCLSLTNARRNALIEMVVISSQNDEILKGLTLMIKSCCLFRLYLTYEPYQMKFSSLHTSLGILWPKGFESEHKFRLLWM